MEAQLKEFLDRLQPAVGYNLVSVVLYGSAATGEFRAGQSDLNILCVVNHADAKDLESLHGISEWWI
ncbi:MAG: nucleotidyltransferase domain-containing protein, partial [Acidobacteria bacterium]|nr:nucleotidyltransferase domain-containing protein [Acidobacteriota bacterium]